MTLPKIKWRVEKNDICTSLWYTIIAEVELGSARYREMHTISQNEINELRYVSTLWKIIENMQGNMLDALGEMYPPDDVFNPHCYLCLSPLPKLGTVAISYVCEECRKYVYGEEGEE